MRIELSQSGMETFLHTLEFQQTQAKEVYGVTMGFKKVESKIQNLNGGIGNLSGALESLEARCESEKVRAGAIEHVIDAAENLVTTVNERDQVAASVIDKSYQDFCGKYNWAAPAADAEEESKSWIDKACDWVKDKFDEVVDLVQDVGDQVIEAIQNFASEIWEDIKEVGFAVGNWFSDRWQDIQNIASNIWESVKKGCKAIQDFCIKHATGIKLAAVIVIGIVEIVACCLDPGLIPELVISLGISFLVNTIEDGWDYYNEKGTLTGFTQSDQFKNEWTLDSVVTTILDGELGFGLGEGINIVLTEGMGLLGKFVEEEVSDLGSSIITSYADGGVDNVGSGLSDWANRNVGILTAIWSLFKSNSTDTVDIEATELFKVC